MQDKGHGYIRYQNASDLFDMADATGGLDVETILREFSRSTYHSLLKKIMKGWPFKATGIPILFMRGI